MALLTVSAVIARRCGVQDVRALLGNGGGHQVVVMGSPQDWKNTFGVVVQPEQKGGTDLEPTADGEPDLHLYLHKDRNEVRLAVGTLIAPGMQPGERARAEAQHIDPDLGHDDDFIVFLVRTEDGRYWVRGQTLSSTPPQLRQFVPDADKPPHEAGVYASKLAGGVALSATEQRIWKALLDYKVVLLYGPPGTGKTFSMLAIREAFTKGVAQLGLDTTDAVQPFRVTTPAASVPPQRKTEFVTFHQSLTYESFVVGLRPKPGKGGIPEFAPRDGVFLKLAEHALQKNAASLLLVDEINRGNVADIFGELITLLELDKRIGADGADLPTTVAVTLPLEPESEDLDQRFKMPHQFYLLAGMNSLDRSVAPLDSAMRRRFRVIHLAPDLALAERILLGGTPRSIGIADLAQPTTVEAKTVALHVLERLNTGIRADWGPEFLLGHSYVLAVRDSATLISACAEAILPQVFELYRDRPRDLAELIGHEEAPQGASVAEGSTLQEELSTGLGQGAPLGLIDLAREQPLDALRRLYYLAYRKAWAAAP